MTSESRKTMVPLIKNLSIRHHCKRGAFPIDYYPKTIVYTELFPMQSKP